MSTRGLLIFVSLTFAPAAAFAQGTTSDDGSSVEAPTEDTAVEDDVPAPQDTAAPEEQPAIEEAGTEEPAEDALARESGAQAEPPEDISGDLRQREAVRPWHVAFGTATGISTYATTILGFLTFNDRYGWSGEPADAGCVSGSPIFGTEACSGAPISHLIAATTASVMFTATFVLSLFMPDPLHVDEGGGEHATLLTVHKTLRWGLLGLFVAQLVLGSITAAGGIDDFSDRRTLAVTHLVVGSVTMATMTTQGLIGSIMEW